MGLLSKLKSLLGMDQSDGSRSSGVDVTVERDPDADTERAVKEGTDDGRDEADNEATAAATGTDAAASTESLVDEDAATDPDEAAEPAEAAVAEDADDEPESDTADDGGEEADSGEADDLTEIKGIGPAYADRLRDAGVETFADLADADDDELAEATDLSPKRVGRWIDRAQHR